MALEHIRLHRFNPFRLNIDRCCLCKQGRSVDESLNNKHPSNDSLCHICRDILRQQTSTASCTQCGLPITLNSTGSCGACLTSPPFRRKTLSGALYQFPVDRMITAFKYNAKLHYLSPLLDQLIDNIHHTYDIAKRPQLLIPIPLHPKKLRDRGFNQSVLISKGLSQALNIPVASVLRRTKHTEPQSRLSAKARQRNLTNAFKITKTGQATIQGKTLAIIDDVITTGTTIEKAAQHLLQAGAREVDAWSLARA